MSLSSFSFAIKKGLRPKSNRENIMFVRKGLRVTQDAYFSLLTHIKQLLLVTFCEKLQEMELFFGHTDGRTDGQTDVEVEIVI